MNSTRRAAILCISALTLCATLSSTTLQAQTPGYTVPPFTPMPEQPLVIERVEPPTAVYPKLEATSDASRTTPQQQQKPVLKKEQRGKIFEFWLPGKRRKAPADSD